MGLREDVRRAEELAENAARIANDLDFLLRELRSALRAHELDEAREKCEALIKERS